MDRLKQVWVEMLADPADVSRPDEPDHAHHRVSRARLLRRSALGAGAISVGGAAAAALASAKGSPTLPARDREVLRFALMLEQLQAAFYSEALRAGKLTGEPRQFAEVVGGEEQAHLRYLRAELGAGAGPASSYRFADAVSTNARFVAAAVQLEDTGVAAYNGQAENVSRSTLRAVARVMSVEARHAAWARAMAGKLPAPSAADAPISASAAMQAIRPFMA